MKYRKYVLVICGFIYTILLCQAWNISFLSSVGGEQAAETAQDIDADNTVKEKPKIAITFDDGPNAESTSRLLDGLKERDVKATFFVIGKLIEGNEDLIKRQKEEGHIIGNHTYNHVDITRMSDADAMEEIRRTNEAVKKVTGDDVMFVRPPFGVWQKKLESELNVLPVMWSVDPLDWTTENTDEIVNKVVTKVKENDIILLHDCYQSSVDAAFRIIDILKKQGYEFVTVDEMILN